MSDYARRLWAADLAYPGLGDPSQPDLGGLYAAYKAHTKEIMADKAADSPLAALVGKLMDAKQELGQDSFSGSATELHGALESQAAGMDISQPWWPKDPSWLGRRLSEEDAPLREFGFAVEQSRKNKARTITITLLPLDG
jgi:hypothetical protein